MRLCLFTAVIAVAFAQIQDNQNGLDDLDVGSEPVHIMPGQIDNDDSSILDSTGPRPENTEPRLMGSFVCNRPANWQSNVTLADVCGSDSHIVLVNPTDSAIQAGEVSFSITPQCGSSNAHPLFGKVDYNEIPRNGSINLTGFTNIRTPVENLPCGIGCILANVSGLTTPLFAIYELPCGVEESDIKLEIQNFQQSQQPIVVPWGKSLDEILGDGAVVKVTNLGEPLKTRSLELAISLSAFLRKSEFKNINLTEYAVEHFEASWKDHAVYGDKLYQPSYEEEEYDRENRTSEELEDREKRQSEMGQEEDEHDMGQEEEHFANPVKGIFDDVVHSLEDRSWRPRPCQEKFQIQDDIDVFGNDIALNSGPLATNAVLEVDVSKIVLSSKDPFACDEELTLILALDALEMINDPDLCNNFVEIPIFLECPENRDFEVTPCEILIDPRTRGQNIFVKQHDQPGYALAFKGAGQQLEEDPYESFSTFSELRNFNVIEKRLLRMSNAHPGMCRLAELSQQMDEQDFLRNARVNEDHLDVESSLDPTEAYENLQDKLDEMESADSFSHEDHCRMYKAARFLWVFMVLKDYDYLEKFVRLSKELRMEFPYNPEDEEGCQRLWEEAANEDLNIDNWYFRPHSDTDDVFKLMIQNINLTPAQSNFLKSVVLHIGREQLETNDTEMLTMELNKTLANSCPNTFQRSRLASLNKLDQFLVMYKEYTTALFSGSSWANLDGEVPCGQALIQHFVRRGGGKLINKRSGWAKQKPIEYYSSLYKQNLVMLSQLFKEDPTLAENYDSVREAVLQHLNATMRMNNELCDHDYPLRNSDDVMPMYWMMREGKILQGFRTPLDEDFGRVGGRRKALWRYVATCDCSSCNDEERAGDRFY